MPRKRVNQNTYHEPTTAEIEALVAEQMKPENLPAWWDEDSGKTARMDGRCINESRNERRRCKRSRK